MVIKMIPQPEYDHCLLYFSFQVFDAFIVVMSFLVDFCFIVFLPDIDTKDFVFILAILLPWRVIRVVNSKYTSYTVPYRIDFFKATRHVWYFLPFYTREITFVTSYLLFYRPNFF